MADLAERRLNELREKARARKAEQTSAPGDTHTSDHTPKGVDVSAYAPVDAPADAETPTPAGVYTHPQAEARIPAPRDVMRRVQHHLRDDQIKRLDALVDRHPGTNRALFVREAVDLYLELVDGE